MAANTQTLSEINQTIDKMERAVFAFKKSDRKKLLRRAARPVRKEMRVRTRSRSNGAKPNTRPGGYTYYPGNYRRSIKTLTKLKRSEDIFVGPEFGGRRGVYQYGRPGMPTDAYYYAMAYGGLAQYRSRLLNPAARASEGAAVRELEKGFIKAFGTRAAQQGLDVS
jgi:hypothetical protein